MPQSALLGGVFIGVLSALPVVSAANCCCLWIVGGGMLAAYLERENNRDSITVARGALVGLLAGVVGALVSFVISLALRPMLAGFEQQMAETAIRLATDMPPELRALLERVGQRGITPLQLIFAVLVQLVINSVFATAGGAIGAAFFKRPGPVSPPPLPPPT